MLEYPRRKDNKRPMIRAVFFDLYGTLAGFHPPKEQVQTQALKSLGINVSHEGIIKGYALADELMSQVNATDAPVPQLEGGDREQFFSEYERLIIKGAGIEVDIETAKRAWAKVREVPYGFKAFDDALPTLAELRERELTLGLLSNLGDGATDMIESLKLAPYLDFVITSKDAGAGKPHPPIFRIALSRAGVRPDDARHVGDSPLSDVQGARGVGIQPILLDRDGVLSDVDDCPRITSLKEVVDYL